jgi:hypothetical protein
MTPNLAPSQHDVEPNNILTCYDNELAGMRSCDPCTKDMNGENVKLLFVHAEIWDSGSHKIKPNLKLTQIIPTKYTRPTLCLCNDPSAPRMKPKYHGPPYAALKIVTKEDQRHSNSGCNTNFIFFVRLQSRC